MEARVLVSEALFTSAEGSKVGSSLWHNIIVELEGDAALLNYREPNNNDVSELYPCLNLSTAQLMKYHHPESIFCDWGKQSIEMRGREGQHTSVVLVGVLDVEVNVRHDGRSLMKRPG